MTQERDYKQAYEAEIEKNRLLAGKLSDAERRVEELDQKLGRIKGSFFWKASRPLRNGYHWLQRTAQRLGCYGSPKGVARKLRSKMIEKQARLQHGTAGFPDADEAKRQRETIFSREVTFSILVPLYNTPEKFLRDMIESVLAQTYEKWELCLADGSDAEHAYVEKICREYARQDAAAGRGPQKSGAAVKGPENQQAGTGVDDSAARGRIKYRKLTKNEGISGNTNACYEMATGNFIALFDHDDILHPSVLYEYSKAICEQGADYLYCDETTFHGNSVDHMLTLHFKPDFAIDNLRANNYICHFSAFDRRLLSGMELFRSQFDGSQDHDMILRLTARAKRVVHVPKLLYYWRSHKGSVASDINAKSYAIEAARGAVADHLNSQGYEGFEITGTKAFETIFRIKYRIEGNPKISIVIANRDHEQDLRRCVGSILEKSSYDNYEIVVVENNSVTPEIFSYYEELKKRPDVKIVTYEGEFNYSKINNFGVRYASGEYILLLNNDTQVITLNWMEELLMYAQRQDVACAGAKLYYQDRTIQHAGIVIGLGAHRTAGHTHYRVAENNLGYMGRLCYAQDVTAVTGACLMVKKALYEQADGLDESFAVALNDVDFCLRLRGLGYLNVWNPYCELYHFESKSRGSDLEGSRAQRYDEEAARFREKWKAQLAAGDPYYNSNFSLDRSDYTLKIQAK